MAFHFSLRHQRFSASLPLLNLIFSLPTTSTSLNLPHSVFTSLTMAIMSIGSFATFLIVCRKLSNPYKTKVIQSDEKKTATCFFLGIIFSLFPYDYPILWSTSPTPLSHYDYLEAHLRFLHASPPLIPRILHIVIFLGLAGLLTKLYKPSESNMLFDGASLVLYMCGITVYIANIVKGMRLVTDGRYGDYVDEKIAAGELDEAQGQILGREDSLKVLSASNTILALVLVGVLVLQAGQWYAERKDALEFESLDNGAGDEGEKSADGGSSSAKVGRQGSLKKKN